MHEAKPTQRSPSQGRPKSVLRFEQLAYLSLVVSLLYTPLNWSTVSKFWNAYPIGYPVTLVLVFGVWILAVWAIVRRRKNWVRWVFAILGVVGAAQAFWEAPTRFQTDGPVVALVYYASTLIYFAAIAFLFTPEAREWFRPPPPPLKGMPVEAYKPLGPRR